MAEDPRNQKENEGRSSDTNQRSVNERRSDGADPQIDEEVSLGGNPDGDENERAEGVHDSGQQAAGSNQPADSSHSSAPTDDQDSSQTVTEGTDEATTNFSSNEENLDRDAAESTESPDDEPVPSDVRNYRRFQKIDGATYDRVNGFLRDRTYITAREWAIARLCADFRTETGIEMTKIGENLPDLVPFMTDTYTPQAVNQARTSFEGKVTKAGSTFLYGAMCDFFSAEELDEVMYEVTEVAKFLLEVEGVELTVDEELDAEDRISSVMREVRRASDELRNNASECPHCGGSIHTTIEETED